MCLLSSRHQWVVLILIGIIMPTANSVFCFSNDNHSTAVCHTPGGACFILHSTAETKSGCMKADLAQALAKDSFDDRCIIRSVVRTTALCICNSTLCNDMTNISYMKDIKENVNISTLQEADIQKYTKRNINDLLKNVSGVFVAPKPKRKLSKHGKSNLQENTKVSTDMSKSVLLLKLKNPLTRNDRTNAKLKYFSQNSPVRQMDNELKVKKSYKLSREKRQLYKVSETNGYVVPNVTYVPMCGAIVLTRDLVLSQPEYAAKVPCPLDFLYIEKFHACYKFETAQQNHSSAKSACRRRGSQILTLDSYEKFRCISNKLESEKKSVDWKGWWTGAFYDSQIREFVWSATGAVISRKDHRWLPALLIYPYDATCVWMVPQIKFSLGNYACKQTSPYICEIRLD